MTFPYGKEPRKPRVNVTHATAELVKFELMDTDVSVANALRRIILAEVPTMSIEIVLILENETVIFDEFLAHRMGLLPLTSHFVGDIPPDMGPGRGFNEYKDCNCFDGCPFCTVEFELDVVNEEDKVMNVTHFDMTETGKYKRDGWGEEKEVKLAPFRDPLLTEEENGRENGILIAKLKKDQHLKMQCHARKGIPKYHAKFMPVATALYNYQPSVELKDEMVNSLTLDEKIEFVESCPRKVFDLDIEDHVEVKNLMACHFCDECVAKAKVFDKKDMVTVKMDPSKFYFTVEAVTKEGPRTAIDVVRAGLRILDWKFQTFIKDAYGDEITEWLPLKPYESVSTR